MASARWPDAETCFMEALQVARTQQAKSLELRAATGLARLWCIEGRREDARDLLAPVYYWFTEGFDTPDLKDAKACRGCSWRIWASIWSMRHNRA